MIISKAHDMRNAHVKYAAAGRLKSLLLLLLLLNAANRTIYTYI